MSSFSVYFSENLKLPTFTTLEFDYASTVWKADVDISLKNHVLDLHDYKLTIVGA